MAAAGDQGLKLMHNNGLDDATRDVFGRCELSCFCGTVFRLQAVRNAGVKSPVIEFGPDGAFG